MVQTISQKLKRSTATKGTQKRNIGVLPELETLLSTFDGEKPEIDPFLWLDKLEKDLVMRKYSQKTTKMHIHYNEEFLEFSKKNPYNIPNEGVREYLYYLVEKNVSTPTLNIAITALKFYHGGSLKRNFVCGIKRPKNGGKLPVVPSPKEVFGILSSVNNIKHRTIL